MQIHTHTNAVAPNLFEVFGVRITAGRGFTAADALPGSSAVIVDQSFAERAAPRGSVLGRRVRYASLGSDGQKKVSPWYDIVGIVPAFAETFTPPSGLGPMSPRLYHAASPALLYPAALVVRVRGGDAVQFTSKFREITATVDPILKLERVNGVLPAWNSERRAFRAIAAVIIAGAFSVLLLSAAGIYAMMSFTVSRRRREIGIRAALGADARRVVTGIFGRASAQLGAGIAVGLAIASAFEWLGPGGTMGDNALDHPAERRRPDVHRRPAGGDRSRAPRTGGAADGSLARGMRTSVLRTHFFRPKGSSLDSDEAQDSASGSGLAADSDRTAWDWSAWWSQAYRPETQLLCQPWARRRRSNRWPPGARRERGRMFTRGGRSTSPPQCTPRRPGADVRA